MPSDNLLQAKTAREITLTVWWGRFGGPYRNRRG